MPALVTSMFRDVVLDAGSGIPATPYSKQRALGERLGPGRIISTNQRR
jgi:hypothetical protein